MIKTKKQFCLDGITEFPLESIYNRKNICEICSFKTNCNHYPKQRIPEIPKEEQNDNKDHFENQSNKENYHFHHSINSLTYFPNFD